MSVKRPLHENWWWGAPGATIVGTAVFGLWVSYGGGDADWGDRPLIRFIGLLVWWVATAEYVARASRHR